MSGISNSSLKLQATLSVMKKSQDLQKNLMSKMIENEAENQLKLQQEANRLQGKGTRVDIKA